MFRKNDVAAAVRVAQAARWAAVLTALLLAGCGREEVAVYFVPREAYHPSGSHSAHPPHTHLHWDLPAGWEERPASGMRAGSFTVTGPEGQTADVSIIPMTEPIGEIENVNRWAGEVGLEPMSAEDIAALGQTVQIGSAAARLFDLPGTKPPPGKTSPQHNLAAYLLRNGTTWYFKMRGDSPLVEREKASFVKLLASIDFHDGPDEAPAPVAASSAGPAAGSGASGLAYQVPAGWKEQPAQGMRLASFTVGDSAETADVSVIALAGEGGGLLANVNRWREQIGLAAVTEAELSRLTAPLDLHGRQATLVELTGEGASQRTLAAVISHGGRTWFIKMTGADPLVARQKAALVEFVQSIQLPNV